MRVVLTRPQPECDAWAAQLRTEGWKALAFPLLEIGPCPEPVKVQAVLRQLLDAEQERIASESIKWRAVMFVSGAAFHGLAQALGPELMTRLKQQTQKGLRCWVTGPGSAQVLVQAGIEPQAIDLPQYQELPDHHPDNIPKFDSQALWERVCTQIQGRGQHQQVLLVRGANEIGDYEGTPWLEEQLLKWGVQTFSVLAYQRNAPARTPEWQAKWEQANRPDNIWVFSSSQGLKHLPALDGCERRAVVTHPRIEKPVRALGFTDVRLAVPQLPSVLTSLKSFYD